MKNLSIFVSIFILFAVLNVVYSQLHRQSEPLNIGWIWSVPYDLSNTLRAPLGGPLSIILTTGLAMIMLFGLCSAPLYYFLGTPLRKYGTEDADKFNYDDFIALEEGGRSFDFDSFNETVSTFDFQKNAFRFIPEQNYTCQQLLVCHAHGFLTFIPSDYLNLIRVFTKRLPVKEDFKDAITNGLEDQEKCQQEYRSCTKDLLKIMQETLEYAIPPKTFNFYDIL